MQEQWIPAVNGVAMGHSGGQLTAPQSQGCHAVDALTPSPGPRTAFGSARLNLRSPKIMLSNQKLSRGGMGIYTSSVRLQ